MIVPFPPAGSSDILARLIGPWLSDRLGQPFVIENRPGAATNIGTEVVVRAPPDGYTLLVFEASQAINATLYDKLNFVFLRDIAPIACIIRTPLVMEVHRFRPKRSLSLLPTPKPTRARSTWRRRAPGRRPTWPANCSRW